MHISFVKMNIGCRELTGIFFSAFSCRHNSYRAESCLRNGRHINISRCICLKSLRGCQGGSHRTFCRSIRPTCSCAAVCQGVLVYQAYCHQQHFFNRNICCKSKLQPQDCPSIGKCPQRCAGSLVSTACTHHCPLLHIIQCSPLRGIIHGSCRS